MGWQDAPVVGGGQQAQGGQPAWMAAPIVGDEAEPSIPQQAGRGLLRTARSAGAGAAGIGDIINAPLDAVLGMAGSNFRFGSPSQAIRQGFDTATQGTPYSTAPQNATERVVDTASEFLSGAAPFKLAQMATQAPRAASILSQLAPQTGKELVSLAGAGGGAGIAKEVAPDSTIAPLIGALAGGAATQIAMNAPAAIERGVRNIAQGITARSGDELATQALQGKQGAGSIRNEITRMGVVIKPKKAREIVSNIDDALKEVDLIPELSPKTYGVVKRIREQVDSGNGISLNYLDQYRRTLRSAFGEDSVAAGAVRRALDNAVNNAQEGDFVGKGGKVAVELLNRFRKEYSQASKFDDVAEIITKSQNDPNYIKRELTKYMNKKENIRGWSNAEKEALSRAANLGNTNGILKILGKFGFDTARIGSGVGGIFGGAGGAAYGAAVGGPVGAGIGGAVVPAVGTAAKQVYKTATRGQAENLLQTIEGIAPKQIIPGVGNVPLATRAMQAAVPATSAASQAQPTAQTPAVTLPDASSPSSMDVAPLEAMPQPASQFPSMEQKPADAPINPQSSIESTINSAAQATGVDPNLLHAIAYTESSLNPQAQSKTSSAAGLFQITKPTFRTLAKKYGEQYGITMRDVMNPEANALMAAHLTAENADALGKALGREVTAGESYIAHFMGARGAAMLLQADPNKLAPKTFPVQAKANRNIFFDGRRPRTNGELAYLLASKVESKQPTQGEI
jgi:hypothetical protein